MSRYRLLLTPAQETVLWKLLPDPAVTTIVSENRDRLAVRRRPPPGGPRCLRPRSVALDADEMADDLVRDMTEVLTSSAAGDAV
jgi:putative resolvase